MKKIFYCTLAGLMMAYFPADGGSVKDRFHEGFAAPAENGITAGNASLSAARPEAMDTSDTSAAKNRPAPDFRLPDLDGRMVRLSDFRGKWVVIDFWGSWCGWCIKGFPALKDAYAKYGDRIVIIGVDCNDTKERWRAAVKIYELPWLNLYNGNGAELYKAYGIQGFPTKAIISPEGEIVDFTVGEDPSFFTRLASFVK